MDYNTPRDAETAFYEAFSEIDVASMMAVWADRETIVCVHPMGPMVRGRRAVESSWRGIFTGGAMIRFHITDSERTEGSDIAVHCVHENIAFGVEFEQHTLVIATNIYQRTDRGWHMIVHHASPGASTVEAAPEPRRALH